MKVTIAVAALILLSAFPALATPTTPANYSFTGVSASPSDCGNLECTPDIAPDFLSVGITSYEPECQGFACGIIEAGFIDFTSAAFSLDGTFIPGSGTFETSSDWWSNYEDLDLDLTADLAITSFDGVAGSGIASLSGGVSADPNGAFDDVYFDFSVSSFTPADPRDPPDPTPEPPTIALFGSGLAFLVLGLCRKLT